MKRGGVRRDGPGLAFGYSGDRRKDERRGRGDPKSSLLRSFQCFLLFLCISLLILFITWDNGASLQRWREPRDDSSPPAIDIIRPVHRLSDKEHKEIAVDLATIRMPLATERGGAVALPCLPPLYVDFMLDTTEFLPHPRWGYNRSEVLRQLRTDREEIAALQSEFWRRLEQPSEAECANAFSWQLGVYGACASIHLLEFPFTRAFELRRPFLLAPGLNRLRGLQRMNSPTKQRCPDGSVHCFLKPFSTCDAKKAPSPHFPELHQWPRHHVPPAYAHKGYFWWFSQVITYITRPQPHIVEMASALKQRFGLDRRPYIGLQIRWGDKCKLGGVSKGCHPVGHYMQKLQRLRALYGISDVFVGTDSDTVVQLLRTNYTNLGFRFHINEFNRSALTLLEETATPRDGLDSCHMRGLCDPVADFEAMMIDLQVFAEADALLLSLVSNVGRAIVEISYGRRGCHVPFISIDDTWCWNGGRGRGGYSRWSAIQQNVIDQLFRTRMLIIGFLGDGC